MAQEANGLPYQSGNPSGVGAVYFDKTIEPLALHLQNLKELDGGDDFWKAYKLKEIADQKKAKLAEDITKDLAVNPDGARPEDIQNDFIPAMAAIRSKFAKVVGRLGGNNPQLTRDQEYLDMLSEKNALMARMLQSKEINKRLVMDATKYDPTKHDDQSLADLAKARGMNLKDATAFLSERGGTFLSPMAANLQKPLEESFANLAPHIYNVTETPVTKNGQVFQEKVSVVDPKKLLGSAQAFVLNKAKDVDATWNNMPPESQKHYADAAAIESQILGEDINPKEYYVYKFYKDRLGRKKELEGGQFTPERNEAAKGAKDQDKADALYDLINGVTEINSDVYAKSPEGKPLAVNGKYISTSLGGYAFGSRQEDGVTVPNLIVATRIDPRNPNVIEIRTDKDVANEDKDGFPSNQKGTTFGQKVYKEALLYNLAANSFPNDPMGASSMLKKAAERRKDVTNAGVISTGQTVNAQRPITPSWVQTPVSAVIDTISGVPQVKTETKPSAKSVIVSDGKDIAKWKAGNEYQVGRWVYYNENGQWKKRQK